MSPYRRVLLTLLILWLLVATNPSSSGTASFRKFFSDLDNFHTSTPARCLQTSHRHLCVEPRRAYPELNFILESLFAPHRLPNSPHLADTVNFELIDYGIFTLSKPKLYTNPDDPPHGFIGIFGLWLPVPHPARLTGSVDLRHLITFLRRQVAYVKHTASANQTGRSFERFRERSLPDRPWEWLIASFTIVGGLWLMFPDRTRNHFTLTWQNVRQKGNWWCMVFFHLSHGGSWLRLCRTIVSVNYLAPILVSKRIVTLSGLYGVVLTSSATSTALGMLVLARRYAFGPREITTRAPLEINGGGACVYALLVAGCLSPTSHIPFPGGARPFELLMLNVLFDSFFLAGQKRIADYTAHTGAALGSWLFCSINMYML